jgi:hypothetical protein
MSERPTDVATKTAKVVAVGPTNEYGKTYKYKIGSNNI